MTKVQIADRTRDGHRVLSIFGDLDPAAVAKVRRTLQKALLDSPVPVICDLTGVRSFATATLTVFSGVLATVGGWPDASLALAAPTAPLREALGIAGVTSRVPVFDAVESAVASPRSAWRPELLVRTRPLSFSGLAAAEARTEATAFCQVIDCGPEDLNDARLVASELATNAVRHGRPPVALTMVAGADALTIGVSDASPAPARRAAPYAEGGQGLALVDAIATSWTNELMEGDGKTVSARLKLKHS